MHSGHSACSSSPLLLFITFMMTPEDDTLRSESSPSLLLHRTTITTTFKGRISMLPQLLQMHSFDDNKLWKFLGLLTRTLPGWGHGFTLDNRTHTRTHFSILRTQLDFLFVFRLSFFLFFWLISDSSLEARSPPVPVGLSLACFRTPQNPDRAVRFYLSLARFGVSFLW